MYIRMHVSKRYKWLNDQDLQSPPPPPIWMKYNINNRNMFDKAKTKMSSVSIASRNVNKIGQSFGGTANIETPMSRHDKHPHHFKVHRCQACRHEFCSHWSVMVTSPLFDGYTPSHNGHVQLMPIILCTCRLCIQLFYRINNWLKRNWFLTIRWHQISFRFQKQPLCPFGSALFFLVSVFGLCCHNGFFSLIIFI